MYKRQIAGLITKLLTKPANINENVIIKNYKFENEENSWEGNTCTGGKITYLGENYQEQKNIYKPNEYDSILQTEITKAKTYGEQVVEGVSKIAQALLDLACFKSMSSFRDLVKNGIRNYSILYIFDGNKHATTRSGKASSYVRSLGDQISLSPIKSGPLQMIVLRDHTNSYYIFRKSTGRGQDDTFKLMRVNVVRRGDAVNKFQFSGEVCYYTPKTKWGKSKSEQLVVTPHKECNTIFQRFVGFFPSFRTDSSRSVPVEHKVSAVPKTDAGAAAGAEERKAEEEEELSLIHI